MWLTTEPKVGHYQPTEQPTPTNGVRFGVRLRSDLESVLDPDHRAPPVANIIFRSRIVLYFARMNPKASVASVASVVLLLLASTGVSALPFDADDSQHMGEYSSYRQAGNIYHVKFSPSSSFPLDPTDVDGWINYGVVR
jgi:hypothetical protein